MNGWGIAIFLTVFVVGVICIYATMVTTYKKRDILEGIILSATFGTILMTVIATAIALLSCYSLFLLSVIYIIVCTGMLFLCMKMHTLLDIKQCLVNSFYTKEKLCSVLFLIILFSVLSIYASKPTYYLWSGRDYGIYAINAIHTAQTGSSLYATDEMLSQYYGELNQVIEPEYPAFFSSYLDGYSNNPGDINTQFLSLYWCYLAIGYSLAGLEGLVRMTAVLAVLSLGVFYCFTRRFYNRKVAWIAVGLLAICPAQIWGARITQSEQMAQLLFLFSIFTWSYGINEKKKSALHIAIALIGLNYFCRIDSYIIGIGLTFLCGYFVVVGEFKKNEALGYMLHHLFWFVSSIVSCKLLHTSYFDMQWNGGPLKYLLLVNAVCFIVWFVVFFICILHQKMMPDFITFLCEKKWFITTGAIISSMFFIYVYFVDPLGFHGLYNYMFYICPILFFLFIPGLWINIFISNRCMNHEKVKVLWLLLICGFSSVLMYSISPSITMDHFFMSRRWVSINFPFVFLISSYALVWIWDYNWKQKILKVIAKSFSTVVLIVSIIYLLLQDRILLQNQFYTDLPTQLTELSEELPDDTLILTQNEAVAGYLHNVCDKNIYMIKDDANIEQLYQYIKDGQQVYFMGEQTSSPLWGIKTELVSGRVIRAVGPESCYDYYPKVLSAYERNANLYRLQLSPKRDTVNLITAVVCAAGTKSTKKGLEMEAEGCGFYGPYYKMETGAYRLFFGIDGNDSQHNIGRMEIVINEEVVDSMDISGDGDYIMPIVVENNGDIVQTRFFNTTEEKLYCTYIELVQ